jgi:probable metal-binding protein
MNPSIHGHDVLEMMMRTKVNYNDQTLLEAIELNFGKQARFHTCSASDMSAAELIQFLKGRGKFKNLKDGFTANVEEICGHEH